ncbi:hypothetical protein TanjilG_22209 [Lupinus angustifolius]|uniref:Homeobox domain-containing protein n=1 Tax=Lupinus angustifolius TaxID=3871 RepID=A0A4P1QUI1_LUPAN|nr:hypothetical protein TanjilG_22209 [Lupinus angustifolius]
MFDLTSSHKISSENDYETSLMDYGEADPEGSEDQDPNPRPKKKGFHRHTQLQIQEMEAFFKQCPHPDDKQRKELSHELGLEPLQVKFWFQNKRTQIKAQHERHENAILKAENEKLRAENIRYKEALSNATCPNCGGPATIGEMSFDEQHLRIENARLREEIDRLSGIVGKYIGKPVTSYSNLSSHNNNNNNNHFLDLGVGNYGAQSSTGMVGEIYGGSSSDLFRSLPVPADADKPMIVELAVAAMEELTRLAQATHPLWNQWSNVFCGIVSRALTHEVLSTGVAGNYNGALQVMSAEFQVPSPLVPTRENYFVRYCKKHQDGTWVIVDVSLDNLRPSIVSRSRRRPSGCVIQELPNGYSKVIWIEHVEVDDRVVHSIYKPLVDSGIAFGAKRWVATLDRQCERLASSMASNISAGDLSVITSPEGRKSMLNLAERMVMSFCTGVGASTSHAWTTLSATGCDDVRVMTRKSMDDPGRPPGIVLSAATSFWLSVPPKTVFDFLRDENSRREWDILSNGGQVQEMAHIANGHDPGNCVSLLRVNSVNSNQSNMLILQECCTDSSGSYVVYAPVDIVAMNVVLSGGDPDYVALLPSGFAILPDGPGLNNGGGIVDVGSGGSLLTVAFQILVDSAPTAKLSLASVATVNSLIKCTVERIKAALISHNT